MMPGVCIWDDNLSPLFFLTILPTPGLLESSLIRFAFRSTIESVLHFVPENVNLGHSIGQLGW